jgi:hypothetical protein
MQSPLSRRVLTAVLLIAASLSLSANAEGSGASLDAPVAPSATVAPFTLVVQMTGLMMLVPENRSRRPTNIFMPPTPDLETHYPIIAFRGDSTEWCFAWHEGLCVVDMSGWSLDPIGITTTGVGLAQVPRGALNVSRGAGGKELDLDRARESARSWLTLRGGLETRSCSLVTWWFRPYASINNEPIPFINVLEWSIRNLQQEEIVLTRRSIEDSTPPQELARLRPTAGRVELLVAHLTAQDIIDIFKPELYSQFRPVVSAPATHAAPHTLSLKAMSTGIEPHMRAFYRFLDADESRHRMPTSPVATDSVCPITILGLESWHDGRVQTRGIKTYGCVVASGGED